MIRILLLLLTGVHVYANGPCGDFFNYACMSGNQGRSDGTGSVSSTANLRSRLSEVTRNEQVRFIGRFNQLINQNPDLQTQIALAAGCERISLSSCANYGGAVSQVASYIFNREVVIGSEGNLIAPSAIQFSINIQRSIRRNVLVKNIINESITSIDRQLIPSERSNFVKNNAFPEVQNQIIQIINQLPESAARTAMLQRLLTITVKTDFCSGNRQDLLSPNAEYDRETKTVNVCLNYLFRTDSLFSLMKTLSHEISHSIDPCNDISTEVWRPLVRCFSNPRSGGISSLCSKQRGQVNEFFCDWMASEVLGRMQNSNFFSNLSSHQFSVGMANSHPYCEFKHFSDRRSPDSSHPRAQERLNLLVANPLIRTRMGCQDVSPQLSYCPINGVPTQESTVPEIDESRSAQ